MAEQSMRLPESIAIPEESIVQFCRKWGVAELALFGSALTDGFRPESDIDLLVAFAPEVEWSLLDFIKMEQELEALLGRDVDLVSKRALERSTNWIRRDAILGSARPVYVKG